MFSEPVSSEPAIRVEDLSKAYRIYAAPTDRLKQAVMPRLRRLAAPLLRAMGRPVESPPYFREFWALRALSFELRPGETVGVIGRNGAGKSTLLQLICGTLSPSLGRVEVRGRVAALLELGSGFNPEYTGRQNVFLNASVLGLTQEETEARLPDILAFADIGSFVDQPVKTYSSGMAMRLAFAVIAHVDADVLIVDEALAVGDAYFQQKCMRWLRAFQERGAVLFCGHDPGAVLSLCQRAIWLDHGAVRLMGPAKDVVEAYGAFETAAAMGLSPDQVQLAAGPGAATPGEAAAALQPVPDLQPVPEGGTAFGSGRARIEALGLQDTEGHPLTLVRGGTEVVLLLRIRARDGIHRGIAGFTVKDRLGQELFGEHTDEPGVMPEFDLAAGETALARFRFVMPDLAPGRYSITPAFASGTQAEHVQHHRVHDALFFDLLPRRSVGTLFRVGMIDRSVTAGGAA